jgi:hypothetical protein
MCGHRVDRVNRVGGPRDVVLLQTTTASHPLYNPRHTVTSRAVRVQDLNMLCQTHGRERSAEEYAQLLGAAGFVDVQARKTGTYLDAVLARKPEEAATEGGSGGVGLG